MTDISARWASTADGFDAVVDAVDDWSAPTPCASWEARDIVAHLVEWVPEFLAAGGTPLSQPEQQEASVADDPAVAWRALRQQLDALLAAADPAERAFEHPMVDALPLDTALDRFVVSDVFIHTWDLARAAGVEAEMDTEQAEEYFRGMEPMADMLAQSEHFETRVPVPDSASAVDRLIALTGRDPR